MDPGIDVMVFPGDAKFVKCNTGRPDDRVAILQFTSRADRRFFFWLQVPWYTKSLGAERGAGTQVASMRTPLWANEADYSSL